MGGEKWICTEADGALKGGGGEAYTAGSTVHGCQVSKLGQNNQK